ncbi:MAG: signal recognition particle protein [Caldisericaceae bacterium]|nr:signal recognition particle protein [Caldisericaceae bacterium]
MIIFDNLKINLQNIFKKLRSKGKLSNEDIKTSLREIRVTLLEADVNYKIVKEIVEKVEEEAKKQNIMESLTPAEQIITILYNEIKNILGDASPLNIEPNKKNLVMLVGLQGSGKTTTAAKLAKFLKKQGKRPLLIPFDFKRPAAMEQLIMLAKNNSLEVFGEMTGTPIPVLQKALAYMENDKFDIGLIDSAGRKEIDTETMEELRTVANTFAINETLLVLDSTIGQGALKIAEGFEQYIPLTGGIFTKYDSSAKGGSILSFRYVTGKPVKFIGVGEKIDDLEIFHPERVVSKIVGRGDLATLAEKAEQTISREEGKDLFEKIQNDTFDLNDYKNQLDAIKKMGGFSSILSSMPVIPGMNLNALSDEKMLVKTEAIINGMTKEEKANPEIIDGSRKKRIAKGSGVTNHEINVFLKNYTMFKKFMQGTKNVKSIDQILKLR